MMSRLIVSAFLAAVSGLAFAGTAAAGSNNTIYVLQESSTGAGNTLTVDQSLANDSVVRGLNAALPATQRGDRNSADLTITGNGGVIELLQDSSSNPSVQGNTAAVAVDGNATATVSQTGALNTADLAVSGNLASGTIVQSGVFNDAELEVSGSGASGSITQNGNANTTNLEVLGAGTTVDYTLNGTGLSNTQAGGLQVFTNGATVTITQTAVVPISR